MTKIIKYFSVSILLFLSFSGASQNYNFKKYSTDKGLSDPFVYTINTDINGFLWVGTGDGLCKYNGFEFTTSEADDTLTEGFVTSSYKDDSKNLWFGHNFGELTIFDGNKFNKIKTEGLAKSKITDICGDNSGNIFVTTQNDGLLIIDKDYKIDSFKIQFESKLLYSINYVGNNRLLIGMSDGLYLYKINQDNILLQYKLEEISWTAVTTIQTSKQDGGYWIGTEDDGFYYLKRKNDEFEAYEINKISEKFDLGYENVQSIIEDNDNNLWIST
ncbi:MAG: two-component regulator propeller domain-containing protein, partial [Bacteroidota bacterium]|nr:two-component regulator propeller domain-containing protein [Bacteroidota bacterium]